ncbi:MAG: right-handed parallel beta-helix repeat-containing protein [Sphingomonadaceae bacterium]|nr:right-handed parallel beta-helix repeat-containing protein [Sphingomonadaceae bacterium]
MNLRLLIAISALLIAANGTVTPSAAQPRSAQTFYVDYDSGSDRNSGLRPDDGWQHAPGDPAAEARPKATRLVAGDRVILAAGVTYRGTIVAGDSGVRGVPIVYEGAAGARAVINGAVPVRAIPCAGNPACAVAATGAVLLRIDRTAALEGTIFDGEGPMRLAQSPNPKVALYADEPTDFYSIPTDRIQTGQVRLPIAAKDCQSDCGMEIALWVQPNVVVTRPVSSVQESVASFDPQGIKFYTDRETRYALRGLTQFLDEPGEFLPIQDGLVLAIPRGTGSCCAIATGSGGILIRNASWITISNLDFEQMADAGKFGKGIAIFANSPGIAGLTIIGNRFRNFDLRAGTGVINLRGVSDLVIANNQIDTVVRGSGIRLAGPSQRTRIEGNRIERIGRTAIYVSDASDVEVTENYIGDIKGVHGNGLTAYLGNQRVTFRRNTVIDAKQPATFHGNGEESLTPQFITFEENLLITTPDSLGSLISWGRTTRNVIIRDNILLGGRFGLRMNVTDQNVLIERNLGMPPAPTARVIEPMNSRANRWLLSRPGWEIDLERHARGQTPLSPVQQVKVCKSMFGEAAKGRAAGANFVCP